MARATKAAAMNCENSEIILVALFVFKSYPLKLLRMFCLAQ